MRTISAPPAPMPASSHWKPLSADGDDATGVSVCGLTGQVGGAAICGWTGAGIGFCWSGAATSVPDVMLPEPPIVTPGVSMSGAAGSARAAPAVVRVSAPAAATAPSARERDRTDWLLLGALRGGRSLDPCDASLAPARPQRRRTRRERVLLRLRRRG